MSSLSRHVKVFEKYPKLVVARDVVNIVLGYLSDSDRKDLVEYINKSYGETK